MQEISLQVFINQWMPQGRLTSDMPSRLANNVLKFSIAAGTLSKRFFRRSFSYGGFYGGGMRWRPRESAWGRKFSHPTLYDSHRLRDGIKGSLTKATTESFMKVHNRLNKNREARYHIWTEEESNYEKGKRGKKKKGKPQNYAAIHNTDPDKHNFTVNQYPGGQRKPVQRKFIGYSNNINLEIEKLMPMLFKGFPNA